MRNYFKRRARKCVSFVRRQDFFTFETFLCVFFFVFWKFSFFFRLTPCFLLRFENCVFSCPMPIFWMIFFRQHLSKRERLCGCFCWREIVFFFLSIVFSSWQKTTSWSRSNKCHLIECLLHRRKFWNLHASSIYLIFSTLRWHQLIDVELLGSKFWPNAVGNLSRLFYCCGTF